MKLFFKKEEGFEEFEIEALNHYKKTYLLKLEGIDNLEQADRFAGAEIFVREKDLHPLEEDQFYHFQIIGCSVRTQAGEKVGIVEDLFIIRDNILLVVREGKKEILIPFSRSICPEVNLSRKEIVVDPPEGLLDLNEI